MGRYDNDQKHAQRCPECGGYYDPTVNEDCPDCEASRADAKHRMRNGHEEDDTP